MLFAKKKKRKKKLKWIFRPNKRMNAKLRRAKVSWYKTFGKFKNSSFRASIIIQWGKRNPSQPWLHAIPLFDFVLVFLHFRDTYNEFIFHLDCKVAADLTTRHKEKQTGRFLPKNIWPYILRTASAFAIFAYKIRAKNFFYFFFGCLLGLITLFKRLIIPS